MTAVLQSERIKMDKNRSSIEGKNIATFLVEYYTEVKRKFPDDEHRHYLFTPRNITQIVFGLLRYEINQKNMDSLYEGLNNELNRTMRDRLVNVESQVRHDALIGSLLKARFSFQPVQGVYFVSSGGRTLNRLTRPDFVQLVSQGLIAYEREFKEMRLHLLDEVLNLAQALDRSVSSAGHILLAGRAGIGRRSVVSLTATMLRLDMVSPPTTRD